MNGALHLIAVFSVLAALIIAATQFLPCRHKWVERNRLHHRGITRVFYSCDKCGERWP